MSQNSIYSLQIKCSDCNFRLSVNDRILYDLNRGANINAELPINTFLLSSNNKFNCTITPPKGFDSIPESAKLTLNLMQSTINNNSQSKQIAAFQTRSFKIDEKNLPKTEDNLSGTINVSVSYKTIIESGIEINNTEAVKYELYDRYLNISRLFQDKKVDDVLSLFYQRNYETANLTGRLQSEIVSDIKIDYEDYVNDSLLELWEFTPEKVFLKVYGYNKLVCLEVANGNQPICFLNRKDRIAIYIPIYFFRNPTSKELEVIR